MLSINDMANGIAYTLYNKTKIHSFAFKANTNFIPAYVVNLDEKGCTVIACGKQVERKISISVSCYPLKGAIGDSHLLVRRLMENLFPYFTVCGRNLVPMNGKCHKIDGILHFDFEIFFCDVLETEIDDTQLMGDIKMDIFSKD